MLHPGHALYKSLPHFLILRVYLEFFAVVVSKCLLIVKKLLRYIASTGTKSACPCNRSCSSIAHNSLLLLQHSMQENSDHVMHLQLLLHWGDVCQLVSEDLQHSIYSLFPIKWWQTGPQ